MLIYQTFMSLSEALYPLYLETIYDKDMRREERLDKYTCNSSSRDHKTVARYFMS